MLAYLKGQALLWLPLLFFLVQCAHAQESPCTVHAEGKFYDLNPLQASKDYQIKMATGKVLSLNVCQSVKTELFGLKDGIDAADVAGFIRLSHGDFSVGKVNSSLAVIDSRPRITLSEGSRCKAQGGQATEHIKASSVVEFMCDRSVSGSGTPRLIAALPPGDEESGCAFVVEWRTPYACPTSEGFGVLSFLATLGMIFLALLLTYTIAGTLYNRFVLDLRGYDQIPQFSFESMRYHATEAFEWIRDMAGIIAVNLCSRSSGGGYHSLASENPRTPNPVSHQSQVSGFGHNTDVEHDAGMKSPPAGFVRPQPSLAKPSFQRTQPQINPASHQAQVAQSLSFTASSPPQQTNPSISRKLGPDSRKSTQDEHDFMLGSDDEDAEELGEISAPPSTSTTPSAPASHLSVSPPTTPTPAVPNPAAAARGRDLGAQGAIQL